MESNLRKSSKKLAEDSDDTNDMKYTCQMVNTSTKEKRKAKESSQKFPEDMKLKKREENSTVAQEVSHEVP